MQVTVRRHRRRMPEPPYQILDRRAHGGRDCLASVAQIVKPESRQARLAPGDPRGMGTGPAADSNGDSNSSSHRLPAATGDSA
jgi:hypothetical protein